MGTQTGVIRTASFEMVANHMKALCRGAILCRRLLRGAAPGNAVSEYYQSVSVGALNLNVTAANPYLPDGDGAPCADW